MFLFYMQGKAGQYRHGLPSFCSSTVEQTTDNRPTHVQLMPEGPTTGAQMSTWQEFDQSMQDADAVDYDLPPYDLAGRVLFRFRPPNDDTIFGIEIIGYDSDKGPFWLHESGFMDQTIGDMVDLELEGFYVLEGVIGHSWQDYYGEYNEEWLFKFCRRATEEEIRTEALEDKPGS
jgi:hypothetical protein